jgi:hypothetical protein
MVAAAANRCSFWGGPAQGGELLELLPPFGWVAVCVLERKDWEDWERRSRTSRRRCSLSLSLSLTLALTLSLTPTLSLTLTLSLALSLSLSPTPTPTLSLSLSLTLGDTSRGRCSAGSNGRASSTSRQPREWATTR